MSIVESEGPPSWSLDASETGESTKCPWVGVVEGTAGEKNRETVTASLDHSVSCSTVVAEFWRHRESNQLTISSPGEWR